MRKLLFVLLVGLIGACGPEADPHAAKVAWLMEGLTQPDLADSVQARVRSFLFLDQDLPQLHTALTEPMPPSSRQALLAVLRTVYDEQTPERIADQYAGWEAVTQVVALNTLAEIGTAPALQAWQRLLGEQPPAVAAPELRPIFAPLFAVPERLAGQFPALLALAEAEPAFKPVVIEALAIGLQAKQVAPAAIRAQSPLLLAWLEGTLQARQQAAGGSPERQRATRLAEDLSLCLAYVPEQPAVNQWLLGSLDASDPQLQLMGVRACLQAGMPVAQAIVDELAGQDLTRNALYLLLDQRGERQRFPAAARTQAAFAAGDLAQWLLAHGYEASSLELLGSFPLDSSAASEPVYAFRFWSQGSWRLGISGPQPADSTRIREASYLTGSDLTPYHRYEWEERARQMAEGL